jgi:Big-like domain-containing protein
MQNLGGHVPLLLLASSFACTTDTPVDPVTTTAPSFAVGVSDCKTTIGPDAVPGFHRMRNGCNLVIRVGNDAANVPNVSSSIQSAVGVWNAALLSDQASGEPKFEYTTSTTPTVKVKVNGNAASYCGTTAGTPPNLITLIPKTTSASCPTNEGAVEDVLVHEFAHVLGWPSGQHKVRVAGVSSHCAVVLPDDRSITGVVCQHDVERIYASYGIVPLSGVTASNFLGRHIVTGVNTPGSISLTKGASTTLSVSQLQFARALTGSVALGSTKLTWSTDNPAVATVNSNGLVTAVNGGTTTIRAKVDPSTLSSAYQVGGLMSQHGRETAVTVTVPTYKPPGPGFRVTDITGVDPMTSDGPYTFGVVVYNGDSPSSLTVKWSFSASNGAFAPFTTAYGPPSYTLSVPPGSYEIRVTATPRNQVPTGGYILGGSYIEDFGVCTGGGGGVDPLRTGTRIGENALPGC